MMPHLDRNKLVPAGAIIAPMLAVFTMRALLSVGPSTAPAATTSAAPASPPAQTPRAVQLTPAQQAARSWLDSGAAASPARSPMLRVSEPVAIDDLPPIPDIDEPAFEEPGDVLRLSSVAGSGTRAMASIDGRLCRVGDEVLEGWTIEEINSSERSVILRHSGGATARLTTN